MAGEVKIGQLVTITDVTDRERYRQRLEEKTEPLEALNRMIRHDIRNDMAIILCRQIIERHGGEIWVGSEPGEGTMFLFTLPVLDRSSE